MNNTVKDLRTTCNAQFCNAPATHDLGVMRYCSDHYEIRKIQFCDAYVVNANFPKGTAVSKVGGDYRFDGVVVSVFQKLSGMIRYVVEDDRGVLHIYSEKNLTGRDA